MSVGMALTPESSFDLPSPSMISSMGNNDYHAQIPFFVVLAYNI